VETEDIAFLVYTSGTTGLQGRDDSAIERGLQRRSLPTWMKIGPGDSILDFAPLFHITRPGAQLALSQVAGIPLILFHRFDAAEALRLSPQVGARPCASPPSPLTSAPDE